MTGVATVAASSTDRPQAPGGLRLVQAFVNTEDIEAGRDSLSSPAELATWLADHDLPGSGAVSPSALTRVLGLRAALRESLEANAHLRPQGAAAVGDPLAAAANGVPLRVAGSAAGPVLEAAGTGVDAALGTILAAAVKAAADGAWARLKVCRNDRCRWAYWDTSRNRSGVWCTMAVCGNRAKGRAFRARARATVG